MKAKLYIVLLSAIILPAIPAGAQMADSRDFRGGEVVRTSYNHDFFYASRINRFHRSYSSFSYYSPVFTDTYWYTYSPYSWGVSIYGGRVGFGIGYNADRKSVV